jgi:hypothetical protein
MDQLVAYSGTIRLPPVLESRWRRVRIRMPSMRFPKAWGSVRAMKSDRPLDEVS